MKGIDVSHWQHNINFSSVKESGIEFAILKAGGSDAGFYTDSKFEENYTAAAAAGLNVGCYYFAGSKFIGEKNGTADAKKFASIIKSKKFDMPIYLDIEAQPTSEKSGITEAAIAFCDHMEKQGYFIGIYASDISGFKERLDPSIVTKYSSWVARYGKQPEYNRYWSMWQYSSTGAVTGITGNVDLDISNFDFPELIKRKHFNNY
jgi:GH25 family lysozyme M1 (1,4-beta-N-acetylmuramidase)